MKGAFSMSRKGKLGTEEKVKVVRKYLRKEVSAKQAAKEAGVHKKTFQGWVLLYETEGVEGLTPHSRNKVYPVELKLQAVNDYLFGGASCIDLCKKYEIRNICTLRSWIKVYNAHGDIDSVKHSGGGSYMKQGRDTTQEEREEIAKACIASGKNYGQIALKYNISYQQARTWTLKYEELGTAGLEDRRGKRKRDQEPRTELEAAQIEIEQLKHKLYLAEMENYLLKKLDEIARGDASQK